MNVVEVYVLRLRQLRRATPSRDVGEMAREVCLGLLREENLNREDKKKINNILKQINYEKEFLPICEF